MDIVGAFFAAHSLPVLHPLLLHKGALMWTKHAEQEEFTPALKNIFFLLLVYLAFHSCWIMIFCITGCEMFADSQEEREEQDR